MKRLLCVLAAPPYAGSRTVEMLEAARVGAVFDCRVALLARDEGVWALFNGQDGAALGARTVSQVLGAMPAYEVDEVYVCAASLQARGLTPEQLALPATVVDHLEQTALIAAQDAVLSAGS